MKKVEVEWEDAFHGDGPIGVDEFEHFIPFIVTTIGFVVYENKTCLCLGFSIYKREGLIKNWQVIPKKLILKRKTLGE